MFLWILLIFIANCNNPKLLAVLIKDAGSSIHTEESRIKEATTGGEENEYDNATYFDSDYIAAADSETNPREVQKAVCTVTAGEVRASAEAVTTKTLKGVCSSAELNLALKTLEAKLISELEEIKTLLRQQQTQSRGESGSPIKIDITTVESMLAKGNTPLPSPLPSQTVLREVEIKKFNNTLLSDEDVKIFTYYWKLENFVQRVKGNESIVESPVFSIKGKSLRIRASFNHMHRDFLYLQLDYANFDKGEDNYKNNNNIFLDMGGGRLFKEIKSDHQNSFKHKISILDKNNRSNDLVSQEFDNLENGFLVPISALISSSYAKNNSLLIQIIFNL